VGIDDVCKDCFVISSQHYRLTEVNLAVPSGAIVGTVLGAALGYGLGIGHEDKDLATAVGTLFGAAAGNYLGSNWMKKTA
jgi:uncharacterized protein YcfJ